jgi:hypothetical protein
VTRSPDRSLLRPSRSVGPQVIDDKRSDCYETTQSKWPHSCIQGARFNVNGNF